MGIPWSKTHTNLGNIPASIYDLPPLKLLGGEGEKQWNGYKKKVLLIVNVASKWGLTDLNYKQLVVLYNKYNRQGLEVLAFPCGQFMNQEFKNASDIKKFTEKYKVGFDVFEKTNVNGPNTHPLYVFLKYNLSSFNPKSTTTSQANVTDSSKVLLGTIGWNFGKFFVGKKGNVLKYFGPKTPPFDIENDIVEAIKEKDEAKHSKNGGETESGREESASAL